MIDHTARKEADRLLRQPAESGLDLNLDIPRQRGLLFDVNLNLQIDEVFLEAGAFRGSWFPCGEESVRRLCRQEVAGLLSGDYRIVESTEARQRRRQECKNPTVPPGRLLRLGVLNVPLPWPRRRRVLQNRPGP